MSKRLPKLLIEDMLLAARKIRAYTEDFDFVAFEGDEKTQDAVVRNFEIIGEAANKLPPEIWERYSAVDWKGVIGFRHVLIHDYFGIDLNLVWDIAQNLLPHLESELEQIVTDL